jgi:hypothetical protein
MTRALNSGDPVNSRDIKDRLYGWLGPILGSAIALGLCVERARVYNQALANDRDRDVIQLGDPRTRHTVEIKKSEQQPVRELGALNPAAFKDIQTRQQACTVFNGRLVAYYDQTGLIRNCRFRLITDPLMLNLLKTQNAKDINEIPAAVYRLFPHGEPINEGEVEGMEKNLGIKIQGSICTALDKKIVTATGVSFYFVEKCKKRLFPNYASLQEQSDVRQTIQTITPAQLARLPDGPEMPNQASGLSDIWMKIDGDVAWQRSFRASGQGAVLQDSPAAFRKAAEEAEKPINKKNLCREINGRLVSFYGHIYFVENCALREIEEQSLDLQIAIQQGKGIRDLTSLEKRLLKEGKVITSEDALKKLK